MTTLAQLKKYGNDLGFTQSMKSLGFFVGPNGYWFYRRREEILDVICFSIGSCGAWTLPSVALFVDEMVEDYNMNLFPKGFTNQLSYINSLSITEEGIEHPWHKWEVRDESSAKKSFNCISTIMNQSGDAWFKEIKTRADLWNHLKACVEDTAREKTLKRILLGNGPKLT
ncbi:hypothetical protein QFX18_19095 [Saccharophagus degradans]|uniref:hypothetical protein n=1 Tax=Saccharophagus degradans TaxID=86304 RepID=UPI002477E1BB|nr:hypothetical protein [Saccharophagus degradans]WGO98116.1 hypothetical protein QFX18_19095 [Saccharophagus degradans]